MIDVNDWPLLAKKKVFDYIRYNSYRSERYKLLYVATPKVACTSLKWWFATLGGHDRALRSITDSIETDPDLVIHDSFHRVAPDVAHLKPEALAETLASDSYFRFAVVRNPYRRIFSAWQSKILLREPYQIEPYRQCNFVHHPIECAEDIAAAFEGFLEHLAANEAPSYWDVHWTPQAKLLRPDLMNYSKLVKIENAKELGQALAKRLGGDVPDPFANHRTNESLIPYLPELVTGRSSELIRTLYAEDFDTFGYGKQPPDAMKTFSAGQFDLAFRAIALIRGRHQRLGERNGQIANLNQVITERDGQIHILNQAVAELHGHIANLDQMVAARDSQIDSLNQVVAERDRQINAYREQAERIVPQLHEANQRVSSVNQDLAERDRHIANLNQVITERDAQINAYREQAERIVAQLHEARTRISHLDREVAERDLQIARLNQEITEYIQRDVEAEEPRLPDGFDPDIYLKLNPDVAAAELDPAMHYLRHGRRERRPYQLPATNVCGDDGAKEG